MKKPADFSKYFLYRWRYTIGYCLIAAVLLVLLLVIGTRAPAGLSPAEMNAAATSASLSWSNLSTFEVVNLPYHLFQKAIFSVFGMTTFTIKLPSLILGVLAAGGFILLLRRWFTLNVAVLTSLIAVTTGQFLFIAQSGTPSILYIFWSVALLLLGTQVTRATSHRFAAKIAFIGAVALSLYTPLSFYPLLAIVLTVFLHPHLRAILRRLSKKRLIVIGAIWAVLVTPLIILVTRNPSLISELLGLPRQWPPDIIQNIITVFKQYFLFWEPSNTTVMTPVFGLGSMLIIGIGLYRLIRTRETTRSYLVTLLMLCLVPILLINPTFTSITFIPAVLVMAAGITSLIGYWYRLFPRNPYARIGGLVPIVILIGALVSTGLIRYTYGYHYAPTTASLFSKDLQLLPKKTETLVVTKAEQPFYAAAAKYRDGLHVTTQTPSHGTYTVTHAVHQHASKEARRPYSVITDASSSQADRFYLYETRP